MLETGLVRSMGLLGGYTHRLKAAVVVGQPIAAG